MRTRTLGPVMAIAILLAACAPAAPAPTPAPTPKPAAAQPQPTAAKPAPPAAATAPAAAAQKPAPKASAVDQVIQEARKEGAVKVVFPADFGQRGPRRLIEAFNKKYNLDLKVDYTSSASFEVEVSKVTTELKTGGKPSWDVVMAAVRHIGEMDGGKLLTPFDWSGTFPHIPPNAVLADGLFVINGGSYHLPAYNPNLVKPADVPRKWEDLLDPKWQGNIVAQSTASPWVRLTESWGEARVTALVEGLAKQQPAFVSILQVVPRLVSGEYPLAPNVLNNLAFTEAEKGAPIRLAEEVKPVVGDYFGLVVPQRAEHPNAARLFIAFNLTPEAQQIWWEEAKRGAPLVPGPLGDWLKNKEVIYTSTDFLLKEGPRLDLKYLKILGLK
ncbi:MAG: extracellular solute-binding protein [Chloroflexi bacterium]|nr:extracellular solute-binding protein [Chloroflexota bacterium]